MATAEQRQKWNRTYYENGGKAKIQETRRRYRERNYAITDQAKARPCADCGGAYPPHVMDFDHIRGEKVADVSALARRPTSVAKLEAEIIKCEVVCSNCHRDRTYRRRIADELTAEAQALGLDY